MSVVLKRLDKSNLALLERGHTKAYYKKLNSLVLLVKQK